MNHVEKDMFSAHIGIQIVDSSENGRVRLELQPHHLNGVGIVQGGVLFTLADYAIAASANANGGQWVSLSAHIDFMKAVSSGVLLAEAKAVKKGKTIAVYDVEIRCEESNTLLAVVRGTCFCRQ